MSPLYHASEFYRAHPNQGNLNDLLNFHLKEGCVVSTPKVFMMARPVCISGLDPDAWFIEYGSGDMGAMFDLMPFWLPFIAFQRKGRMKVYATATLANRILRDEIPKDGHVDAVLRWWGSWKNQSPTSANAYDRR